VVIREAMVPLLSHLNLLLWVFFLGCGSCISLTLNFLFCSCIGLVLTSWCALDNCKELSLNSGTALLYLICVTFYFNYVY